MTRHPVQQLRGTKQNEKQLFDFVAILILSSNIHFRMSDRVSSKKGKSRSTSISSIRSSLKNKKKSKSIPSSSSSTSRKPVSHSNLAWQATQLPSQVLDKGGYTEHDFFHGLDQDDDDFMGLKEVDGVEVGYEDEGFGGKRIVFKVMDQDTDQESKVDKDSNDPEEQEKKKKDKGKKRKVDLEQLDSETEKQKEPVVSQAKKSKKEKKSEKKVKGKHQEVQSKKDGEEEKSKDLEEDLLKDAFDQSRWQSLQDQLEESFDGELQQSELWVIPFGVFKITSGKSWPDKGQRSNLVRAGIVRSLARGIELRSDREQK